MRGGSPPTTHSDRDRAEGSSRVRFGVLASKDDGLQHTVTQLLHRWKAGDRDAHDALMPIVYEHLRRLAERSLYTERRDHTLQHTALVHEAYLELVKMEVDFNDRAHFFALAARAMRRILVDHARTRKRHKRGSGAEHVPLEDAPEPAVPTGDVDLVALDEALTRLAAIDQRKSEMLEMRYFGGMKQDEMCELLGLSPATIKRDLAWARDWLKVELAL
jgi:RNA polymerase sigma-70 factor, ECF subfamily